jgi:hypothetical protein
MDRPRWRAIALAVACVLVAVGACPPMAEAHGPVAPVASSYLAKVGRLPAGVDGKVVDGDQRMWLRVVPSETVVVLDYGGAPYLRFSRAGVAVNRNSAMFYLNQTPVAETPPAALSPSTPPTWQPVGGGHDYGWHDGRLHALATVALAPGMSFVGRWSIPVRVDGRLSSISGGLWHAGPPSIVWFWPIVVLLLCVLAAWRVRRPELDALVARGLASVALVAFALGGLGRELHGRPTVSIWQAVELALILAFAAWGLRRVLFGRPGYFSFFVIAFAVIWEGAVLITTLLYGFVLIALPAFVVRAATVLCLGCGVGLLLLVFRLSDQFERSSNRTDATDALGGEGDSVAESLV